MLKTAVQTLEHYTFLLKNEGESSKLIELYPQAIEAVGTILNATSSSRGLDDYQRCSPLLLCASLFELEGIPIRAAALYIRAGDCFFAEGRLKEALDCFLKAYQKASSIPSRASKTFASMALLMVAFTALKLGATPLFKNTVKLARSLVDKKTWDSIKQTKYYVLLRTIHQHTRFLPPKKAFMLSQVLNELSNLSVGSSLKEWLQRLLNQVDR